MKYIYGIAKAGLSITFTAALAQAASAQEAERLDPPPERIERGEPRGAAPQRSGLFIEPVGLLFSGMDKNADAVISTSELLSGIGKNWDSFERNPRGARFSQWSEKTFGSVEARPTFLRFDNDFNGMVTKDEFERTLRGEFDRLDKDKDGALTRAEMIVRIDAPRRRSRQNGDRENRTRQDRGGQSDRQSRRPRR